MDLAWDPVSGSITRASGLPASLNNPFLIIADKHSLSRGYLNTPLTTDLQCSNCYFELLHKVFAGHFGPTGDGTSQIRFKLKVVQLLLWVLLSNLTFLLRLHAAAPPQTFGCVSAYLSAFHCFMGPVKHGFQFPLLRCFHSGIGVMSKRFQTQSLSKSLRWQGLLFICHGGCNKL